MPRRIYKLSLARGLTEAYYQLSEEERTTVLGRERATRGKADARVVTPCYDCRWSTDGYLRFFIMEYPGAKSAIMDATGVEKLELFRYLVCETIPGIDAGTEGAAP